MALPLLEVMSGGEGETAGDESGLRHTISGEALQRGNVKEFQNKNPHRDLSKAPQD